MSFEDLQEYEEQPCFEFELDEVDLISTAGVEEQQREETVTPGVQVLRLDAPYVDAQAMLRRTETRRDAAEQAAVLRVQAEAQYASQDYELAIKSLDHALDLLNGDVLISAFREKCVAAHLRLQKADALLVKAEELYKADNFHNMALNVEEALRQFPQHTQAHMWQMRLRAWKLQQVDQNAVAIVVDHKNEEQVLAAATAASKLVFSDLDLVHGSMLNYRRFVSWWQSQIKITHSANRISDEELQQTMTIWYGLDPP